MMRVIALGGYGTFGRFVAKRLCESDHVTEMVIAGRSLDTGKKFAQELGDKASAVRVDALKEEEIISAARGSDLMVSIAGPDYKVSFSAAKAAIQAGVNFCDISADCDNTERVLGLDSAAKAAGVTVLTGIGYAPGETNLLLKHAASKLDVVEDLRLLLVYNLVGMISYFGVDDPGAAALEMRRTGRVNSSWETVMNWAGGRVYVFRKRKLIDVDPSRLQERINFPGAGDAVFFPVGGTEVVTIPHFLKNVESMSFMMCASPPLISGLYLGLADRIRRREIDPGEAAIQFHEGVATRLKDIEAPSSWREPGIVLRAVATGVKDGRRTRYSCWPTWGWMAAPSALTVAALRIMSGDIKQRGVLAPEACLDPMSFFREAALLVSKDAERKELLADSSEALD
jgi:saccharopine dehydrogenase-like NADP-dependent oxidoreductase